MACYVLKKKSGQHRDLRRRVNASVAGGGISERSQSEVESGASWVTCLFVPEAPRQSLSTPGRGWLQTPARVFFYFLHPFCRRQSREGAGGSRAKVESLTRAERGGSERMKVDDFVAMAMMMMMLMDLWWCNVHLTSSHEKPARSPLQERLFLFTKLSRLQWRRSRCKQTQGSKVAQGTPNLSSISGSTTHRGIYHST